MGEVIVVLIVVQAEEEVEREGQEMEVPTVDGHHQLILKKSSSSVPLQKDFCGNQKYFYRDLFCETEALQHLGLIPSFLLLKEHLKKNAGWEQESGAPRKKSEDAQGPQGLH